MIIIVGQNFMSLKKNFSLAFGAQLLILVVSVIRALILPKFLSLEDFGYWEVYWFYVSYVGLFCLGYTDGVYLEYGEYDYKRLPMKLLRSGNRMFLRMLLLFSALAILTIFLFVENEYIVFSLSFAAVNIAILGVTTLYIYIFQITNQFKEYSLFSILDKMVVLITILWLLISNKWSFKYLVIADVVSKLIVLFLIIRKKPELFFGPVESTRVSFYYLYNNICVGVKLMIANLMSMLIIGAGKFIVQISGDISDFAIYSFGISLTGLVLVAVTSVGLVLYPAIKRFPINQYPSLFDKINSFNRLFGLSSLLLYFPVHFLIEWNYPQYKSVLVYLNILFVIVFLQSKIGMLNNTFYKALREEKNLLKANLSCVMLFLILALVFFSLNSEMWVIAACTCAAMFYRCYSSELFLCRKLNLHFRKKTCCEIIFIFLFLISNVTHNIFYSLLFTFTMYVVWFLANLQTNKLLLQSVIHKNKY